MRDWMKKRKWSYGHLMDGCVDILGWMNITIDVIWIVQVPVSLPRHHLASHWTLK